MKVSCFLGENIGFNLLLDKNSVSLEQGKLCDKKYINRFKKRGSVR